MGPDAAGKTAILYKLRFGKIIATLPTIKVKFMEYKSSKCAVW